MTNSEVFNKSYFDFVASLSPCHPLAEAEVELLERLRGEGRFLEYANHAAQVVPAYRCFKFSKVGDALRDSLNKMIAAACAQGNIGVVHKFYRKMLALSYKSVRSDLCSPQDDPGYKLAALAIRPNFIDWVMCYQEFCRSHNELARAESLNALINEVETESWRQLKSYPKDRRPMTEDVFWELIRESRRTTEDGADDEALQDLKLRLLGFSQASVVRFHAILLELCVPLHTSQTWAVGHIVSGDLTEDRFAYFKPWIVFQGQEFYNTFIQNPSIAMMQVEPGTQIVLEDFLVLAEDVFSEREWSTEKLERLKTPELPEIVIDWETEELPDRYPDLWQRFIGEPLD